jgi:hypothetical protein
MMVDAVSGVYMMLVAEYLVHIGNILLVPASFSLDSQCIWPRNLSDGHSPCVFRVLASPTVAYNNLFFIEVRGCKYIG